MGNISTVLPTLGCLFKEILSIWTTNKMFQLLEGGINRVGNMMYNKHEGIFYDKTELFGSIT